MVFQSIFRAKGNGLCAHKINRNPLSLDLITKLGARLLLLFLSIARRVIISTFPCTVTLKRKRIKNDRSTRYFPRGEKKYIAEAEGKLKHH